jgi:hypothetical protein
MCARQSAQLAINVASMVGTANDGMNPTPCTHLARSGESARLSGAVRAKSLISISFNTTQFGVTRPLNKGGWRWYVENISLPA